MSSKAKSENKIFMSYTLSLDKSKIEDLNLNISLASSDLQLVKQVKVTDVNDVFCCLFSQILLKNFIIHHFICSKNNTNKIKLL